MGADATFAYRLAIALMEYATCGGPRSVLLDALDGITSTGAARTWIMKHTGLEAENITVFDLKQHVQRVTREEARKP